MSNPKEHGSNTLSVRGDFYVESGCCISCGVPQSVAPDLVGWTEEELRQCYWKKQPVTAAELEQALKVFEGQELGCHRYAGLNIEIQRRIGISECDHPLLELTITSGDLAEVAEAPKFLQVEELGIISRLIRKLIGRQ
ncbi:MAG TPA: hypothetical protein VJU82_04195 [Acidobacteriaceae bacterium]|nr:hypothetical protein [Acidobacteriaceae bacterium]